MPLHKKASVQTPTFTTKIKTLKKLAESLAQQCGAVIKITIFNPDNRRLGAFYTENIFDNIESGSIIPPLPAIVRDSHSPSKELRLPMTIDQHNYAVPSSQPTSHEPSLSLPSPSMQMLPSAPSSPISNLPETCGKQNHNTSNLKRNRFIASKEKDFREKVNALAVLRSLKRKK